MSINPKHFTSDEPCAKCGGRERYRSTHNCVPCLKALVGRRRIARAAELGTEIKSFNTTRDPLEDLLGDING